MGGGEHGWQPVEDAKNMVAEGNLQWGAVHVPFDCTASGHMPSWTKMCAGMWTRCPAPGISAPSRSRLLP